MQNRYNIHYKVQIFNFGRARKPGILQCWYSFYKDSSNLRIQYRDDESTFVTVSNQTDVQDVIRCCKTVANVGDNNIVRLCVRVDDSVTPRDNKKNVHLQK
jgi:hypothetical protein